MGRVAVLGCGPSGLLAAHAASLREHEVDVLSKKKKSEISGAQYLHAPIPGIHELEFAPARMRYVLQGTVEGYATKVYGKELAGKFATSPESLTREHDAWNLAETYDLLWQWYSDLVFETDLTRIVLGDLMDTGVYDLVLSTVPANVLCQRGHFFTGITIMAGEFSVGLPDNHVICNGEVFPSWYRASNVFGHQWAEWSEESRTPSGNVMRRPPIPLRSIIKPLETNCDCWITGDERTRMVRLGRYGKWHKKELTHHAFEEALDLCDQIS
jgi:hypothetical protein